MMGTETTVTISQGEYQRITRENDQLHLNVQARDAEIRRLESEIADLRETVRGSLKIECAPECSEGAK